MTEMSKHKNDILFTQLMELVSEHKKKLFREIISFRTHHLCIVLEDIFQSQNASAVLRSAECFGIQDVHIIENKNEYTINPDVALGSSKWLSLYRYNQENISNTKTVYSKLKSADYQIVATSPKKGSIPLNKLDISKKTAIVFGSEMNGLSDFAIDNSDIQMQIPMFGFTESFNISVSAAICLHHLSEKMRNSKTIDWQLTEKERNEILLQWAKNVVKSSGLIEKEIKKD